MEEGENALAERIKAEMTVDYNDALEKNFDLAKKFVGITPEGKVNVQRNPAFGGEDRIVLYLIGKAYAARAGYAEADAVENKELLDELGMKEGSLFPWLKFLRDSGKIKQKAGAKGSLHYIPHNLISSELERLNKKADQKK